MVIKIYTCSKKEFDTILYESQLSSIVIFQVLYLVLYIKFFSSSDEIISYKENTAGFILYTWL